MKPMAPTDVSRTTIRIQRDEAGRIALEPLERDATVADVRAWMRRRFEGADPYVPLNHDHLEAPYELFADLWRQSGAAPRFRECVNQACGDLVRDAWYSGSPDWAEWLLRLVATTLPPAAWPFLGELVQGGVTKPEIVRRGHDLHWLRAAASYPEARRLAAWSPLLDEPRYTQIAYRALAHDLEKGARYLPELYASLSPEERPLLMREALHALFARDEVAARRCLTQMVKTRKIHGKVLVSIQSALRKLDRFPLRINKGRWRKPIPKPTISERPAPPLSAKAVSATPPPTVAPSEHPIEPRRDPQLFARAAVNESRAPIASLAAEVARAVPGNE